MTVFLPEGMPTMKAALATVVRRALPRVAQVVRVDVASSADGIFTVTINGEAAAFTAAGSTLAQIRDGLIDAIAELSGAGAVTLAAIVDGDSLSLTALDAGVPFVVAVSGPSAGALVATTTVASFAWSMFWSPQDAPAPSFPYASLRIIAPPKGVGSAETKTENTSPTVMTMVIEQDAVWTVEIQLHARMFADGRPATEVADSAMMASMLELSLDADPDQLAVLEAAGIALQNVMLIRDLTGLGGERSESRAAIDLRLGARSRLSRAADWFDAIEAPVITADDSNDTITGTVEV